MCFNRKIVGRFAKRPVNDYAMRRTRRAFCKTPLLTKPCFILPKKIKHNHAKKAICLAAKRSFRQNVVTLPP